MGRHGHWNGWWLEMGQAMNHRLKMPLTHPYSHGCHPAYAVITPMDIISFSDLQNWMNKLASNSCSGLKNLAFNPP